MRESKEPKLTNAMREPFDRYWASISSSVVAKFGVNYPNVNTDNWRQELPYSPEAEKFLICETVVGLFKDLPDRYICNMNFSYGLCYHISNRLSKYIVKQPGRKSKNTPPLTRFEVQNTVMNNLFFRNPVFVNAFKARYKKPIDLKDDVWCIANPGVVAMYKAINNVTQM